MIVRVEETLVVELRVIVVKTVWGSMGVGVGSVLQVTPGSGVAQASQHTSPVGHGLATQN